MPKDIHIVSSIHSLWFGHLRLLAIAVIWLTRNKHNIFCHLVSFVCSTWTPLLVQYSPCHFLFPESRSKSLCLHWGRWHWKCKPAHFSIDFLFLVMKLESINTFCHQLEPFLPAVFVWWTPQHERDWSKSLAPCYAAFSINTLVPDHITHIFSILNGSVQWLLVTPRWTPISRPRVVEIMLFRALKFGPRSQSMPHLVYGKWAEGKPFCTINIKCISLSLSLCLQVGLLCLSPLLST